MRGYPIAALACLGFLAFPASGLAADGEGSERAAIERGRRIGTGLLWGGVATSAAGGLTLLGIIPTHRNLGLAEWSLSRCMETATACPDQDADVQRWSRARTAVVVTGSVLVASGLTLVAVGVWKRRTARQRLHHLDERTKPEWALAPSFGPNLTGVSLVARF